MIPVTRINQLPSGVPQIVGFSVSLALVDMVPVVFLRPR